MKEFSQPDDGAPYNALAPKDDSLDRIWALVDSNRKLHEPASVFQEGPFFIIQLFSPRPVCHEWVRGVRRRMFYMKLWPFAEVFQV